MKNYDQAAINAVFNNYENFKKIMEDVFAKFEEDLEEAVTFSEAMQLFLDTFEGIASESAATEALDIDLQHYYLREHNQMMASDVQYEIDYVRFKGLDKYVNLVLENIRDQQYATAYMHYMTILQGWKTDKANINKKWLNHYLVTVNDGIGTICQTVNLKAILEDLEGIAEKAKLNRKLQEKLGPTVKVKKLKI